MLQWFLDTFDYLVTTHLRVVLYHPAMLVLAVVLVLQRFARPLFSPDGGIRKHLGNSLNRTFGMGVIILQLFYAPYLKGVIGDDPLGISLCILLVESLVQVGVDLWEHHNTTEGDRLSLCDLLVESKYQDITITFRLVSIYFWVQLVLMGYFLYFCNNDPTMHSRELYSILKWLVALNLTQVTSDDEAGTRFHVAYWSCLLNAPVPAEARRKDQGFLCECIPVPYKLHWAMRCVFDFIVNGICRAIIMGIAPIYLADVKPMDFIKDCLALFFVTRLDDYDNIEFLGKRLRQHRERAGKAPDTFDWLRDAIDEAAGARGARRGPGSDDYSKLPGDSRDDVRHRSVQGEAEMS